MGGFVIYVVVCCQGAVGDLGDLEYFAVLWLHASNAVVVCFGGVGCQGPALRDAKERGYWWGHYRRATACDTPLFMDNLKA